MSTTAKAAFDLVIPSTIEKPVTLATAFTPGRSISIFSTRA